EPPRGRGELPGAGRGAAGASLGAGDALAARGGQEALREVDGPAPGERADGSRRESGRRRQEARRDPPYGRGEQGLLAFPVLIRTHRPHGATRIHEIQEG